MCQGASIVNKLCCELQSVRNGRVGLGQMKAHGTIQQDSLAPWATFTTQYGFCNGCIFLSVTAGQCVVRCIGKAIISRIQVILRQLPLFNFAHIGLIASRDFIKTIHAKKTERFLEIVSRYDLPPEAIEVESIADALPIARKAIAATKKKKAVERSSIDQRIDYRWVDLRTDENQLMFKAQSCMVNAMRKFLLDQNFIEIHTPKLIAAASESGSEVFKVDYFDRNAYLAQSPQFYKQMAMAAGFERIFETGPVFRAEKSYTNKHSTEFSGFDLEFSYITSYKDVMKMEEELLTAGLQAVKDNYGDQIKEMFGQEVIVPTTPFPVVKLADLYKGLEEDFGYVVDDSEKGDLTTEAERLSYDWVKKHYNHEFLFVTDYDAEKRAFYHMRDENGVPQGYDLIWRGVEITTGAQREHRYEVLKKQAEEKGLAEDVKFYLEFFQYGCPPHGGFGLGIDRLTMLLCGLSIKDAEFLFRGPNRLTP